MIKKIKEMFNKIKEKMMSLFLGKDSKGNSILHITRDTKSASALKGKHSNTTIFHSDLPYLRCQTFKITQCSYKKQSSRSSKGMKYISPEGFYFKAEDKFYDEYTNYPTRFCILVVNKVAFLSHKAEFVGSSNFTSNFHTETILTWLKTKDINMDARDAWKIERKTFPNSAFKWGFAPCISNMTTSNSYLIVLYNNNGQIENPNFTNNKIQLDNNTFSVKGVDFTKVQFLTGNKINSYDKTLTINGREYQLINSASKGSSVKMTSEGGINIFVGNKKILSSKINVFTKGAVLKKTALKKSDGWWKLTSNANFKNKDLIYIHDYARTTKEPSDGWHTNDIFISYKEGEKIYLWGRDSKYSYNPKIYLWCKNGDIYTNWMIGDSMNDRAEGTVTVYQYT